mgnify:CR=1 FL=1
MNTCGKLCWAAALAVLLAARPVPAASELQLRWSELPPIVSGKTATLTLLRGAVLRGQVLSVGPEALYMQVKSTSYTDAYPKGRAEIPRESVAVIELTRTNVLRKAFIGVKTGVCLGLAAAGVMLFSSLSKNSTSKEKDPEAARSKLKTTLIYIGALSVAAGVKFGIDAARATGETIVMTIRLIPEPE